MMHPAIIISILMVSMNRCKCSGSEHDPVVELPLGKIRGTFINDFYTFNNIPYAEPPVGSKRFEPPKQFLQSWNTELDGTQAMASCVQFERDKRLSGTEDCLYLHVATPSISCKKMFPVRVQIHRGAFMGGTPDSVDTSILVKRKMVVVTMGYRVGPLGFLSTGDSVISGNNGLKDQRMAFMWVKAYIKSFCGDSNNILLAGSSAGGAAAHMHLLQKSTENYVNAVASHNAVITCPWSLEPRPQELSRTFAKWLNCPTESDALKKCLQSKTLEELREATWGMQYFKNNPFTVFAPVVESPESEDPLIVEHPLEIMKKGNVANVTWLVGYTEREGSYNSASLLTLDENGIPDIDILNSRWTELAPIFLFFNKTMDGEEQQLHSSFLKETYLGNKNFSEENYQLLENMYTEELFKKDIKKAVELHRDNGPGKVYVFYYSYPHSFGLGNLISSRSDINFGADHTADSIFTIPLLPLKPAIMTDKDKKVAENLLDMYLTWANTGILRFGKVNLPLSSNDDDAILKINEHCYSVDGCSVDGDSMCNCYKYL